MGGVDAARELDVCYSTCDHGPSTGVCKFRNGEDVICSEPTGYGCQPQEKLCTTTTTTTTCQRGANFFALVGSSRRVRGDGSVQVPCSVPDGTATNAEYPCQCGTT